MKNKFSIAMSLAVILAMLLTSLALADNVLGDDVDAGGNASKTPGASGTATFQLVANGPDGCNVDGSNSATATIVSDQSWLTINSPGSVTFTQCGSAGAQLIGYSVSSLAPVGGVATVSVSSVTGGKSGNNGWNLNPSTFTVTVVAPPDSTPPSITYVLNPASPDGANGWYVSDVTLTWTVSEPESPGSLVLTGCVDQNITADQLATDYSCSASSDGGSAGPVTVSIKRDATKPTLSPSVSPNPVALNGSATASAGASDATSGLASSSCDAVDTSSVGSHSVTCYAEDNAGNTNTASASYSVVYNFGGFFQPVDNLPAMNSAKAGQAIPLKWRLTDANGAPVLSLTSVTVTVASLSCSLGTTIDQIEEYAAGSSGLQNLGDGYYQFNWKSPTSYATSCKTLNLSLGDGVPHTAQFQFKK